MSGRTHRVAVALGGLALLLGMLTGTAMAMPADPAPHDYRQPDGSVVTLHMRGDEWLHWYEDTGGHAVVDDGGTWRYATLDPSGRLVATPYTLGKVVPEAVGLRADLRPHLGPDAGEARRAAQMPPGAGGASRATVSPTGTVKNLVILCLFSDHTIAANGRAVAAYDSLFNQVNSTGADAPTGSVRDFYYQASYGVLTLQSTVIAWVTLPHTQAYYGNGLNGLPFGANPSPYPTNAAGMVHDALVAADAIVNFGNFDTDNDGYVDAIDIIHSGYGGEQNGNGVNTIWSHKFYLSGTNGGGEWASADDNANHVKVKVDLYHTEPGRFGTSGAALTRVGVVAHETGHFFGLPDLYDIDYTSTGIGNWCTMANSWGWDQTQLYPPLFSAWCRVQLGWVVPGDIAGSGLYTLGQNETAGQVLRVTNGMPSGEYLLIENREPVGFDQQIPQGGIAVWHIDDNVGSNSNEGYPGQSGWPGNGNHFKVALLEADGNYDLEKNVNKGDGGDLYRVSGVSVMNESTLPATDSYTGADAPTGVDIRVVSDPGASMSLWIRTANWVDPTAGGPELGTFQNPYHSLFAAHAAASSDQGIVCKAATWGELVALSKPLLVRSWHGIAWVGH